MPTAKKRATPKQKAIAPPPKGVPFPERMAPQLATLTKSPPAGSGWIYEIKFDGYRILARKRAGEVRLFTRKGNDWTDKLPGLVGELAKLPLEDGWLDGEAVVLDENGIPNFNALQNAFDRSREHSIVYFVFDVPYLNGRDLRRRPQSERSEALRELFATNTSARIRMSEPFETDGASALRSACAMGLEGLIAKRLDGCYEGGERSNAWLKLKCNQRREFVIGGFTNRGQGSKEVGSLLLGVYDEAGNLVPAGSVGTGWDSDTAVKLRELLELIETDVSPFSRPPAAGRWARRAPGSERWVQPRAVADVSYQELTPDGSVRHASFRGIRLHEDPQSIDRQS
jgi:bifunctional non-homologous end joining protein LigD